MNPQQFSSYEDASADRKDRVKKRPPSHPARAAALGSVLLGA